MSVTKQIVKLLSAKYNFALDEALEYVTTQQKTAKSMTKEEKAAARIQQKEQAKAAKLQAKADKAASKVEKENKPKKPRTEAQIAATAKMIEANKLKKLAAAANK